MNIPVDLTNLRSMTDGDVEMEKALFAEFISSFEMGIQGLLLNSTGDYNDVWRTQAHALKGIALNLGAEKLGHLCTQGQQDYRAGKEAKLLLLKNIQAEYEQVRQFLAGMM